MNGKAVVARIHARAAAPNGPDAGFALDRDLEEHVRRGLLTFGACAGRDSRQPMCSVPTSFGGRRMA